MTQLMPSSAAVQTPEPLMRSEIESRIQNCARLPSLRSIDSALRELLNADHSLISQISEVIGRDPSLTARLLRLVNSVYFSLGSTVNSIDEAVFYLGVRKIRQLALATPIIDDFSKLAGKSTVFPWRKFWQHCIATAILTRELSSTLDGDGDEADYVCGLVHDVGKIVMASAFPDHFAEVNRRIQAGETDRRKLELSVLGLDHCEVGAIYLQQHKLPPQMVETARFHHQPLMAVNYPKVVAAVHIANTLVRSSSTGNSGDPWVEGEVDWTELEAWNVLLPSDEDHRERNQAIKAMQRGLSRLPGIVEGLV